MAYYDLNDPERTLGKADSRVVLGFFHFPIHFDQVSFDNESYQSSMVISITHFCLQLMSKSKNRFSRSKIFAKTLTYSPLPNSQERMLAFLSSIV